MYNLFGVAGNICSGRSATLICASFDTDLFWGTELFGERIRGYRRDIGVRGVLQRRLFAMCVSFAFHGLHIIWTTGLDIPWFHLLLESISYHCFDLIS